MKAPQIILLAWWAISLLYTANQHGKPIGKASFWATFTKFVITMSLLYWGGFFGGAQ